MKNYKTWNEMYEETVPAEVKEKIDFEIFLCNEIETMMEKEGISFHDLVQKSGLSRNTVYKFLKLDTIPKIESLEKMANAMNYSMTLIPLYEENSFIKKSGEPKTLKNKKELLSRFKGDFSRILEAANNEKITEIPKVTGISVRTVKNVLEAKQIPKIHTLRKIADVLGYKIAFIQTFPGVNHKNIDSTI